MSTLLLRLEGPLQAWSSQGKLGIRDTEREPTKSGVLGLLGAALGMDRTDDKTLASLAELSMAVRVDRPGTLLRDYHTAGGGSFRGSKDYFVFDTKDCVPTERFYLQDASFLVGLQGPRALLERIARALQSPHYPLFLGRKACPPSEPVLVCISEHALLDALRHEPLRTRDNETAPSRVRVVHETTDPSLGDARQDVPLSFGPYERRYGVRYVRTDWIELTKPQPSTVSP